VERRPMSVRSSKLSASSVAPSICSLRKICWYVSAPQACQYLYFCTSEARKLSTCGLVAYSSRKVARNACTLSTSHL
jgi:hypothetical protein